MTKKRVGSKRNWWWPAVLAGLFLALSYYFWQVPESSLVRGAGFEITHMTSGTVEADTIIAVRFRRALVPQAIVGQELKPSPFTFSPQIEGHAYWTDAKTLVFVPAQPLYEKKNYHALLNLHDQAEKIEFTFRTLGQGLLSWRGGFRPKAPDTPTTVYFEGSLSFSERVGAAALEEALRIELAGKALHFTLISEDNRNFRFETEGLERFPEESRLLVVALGGPPLGLKEDLREEYLLAALKAPLQVLRLEEEKVEDFSQLRILFSDQLNEQKDYQGYLNIRPSIDYKVLVDGNSLVVQGDFRPREKYSIQLFPGIEGVYGQKLADPADYLWEVAISDLNPVVEFLSPGHFLPTAGPRRVAFRTMNVERLRLQVKRVEEENLVAFFEENSYRPSSISFEDYNRYRFLRLGEIIEDRIIEIGPEPNKWIQSELDLSKAIPDGEAALYIIQLDFAETQALYFSPDWDRWDISSHVYQRGRAVKHLLVSDVGITAKEMLGDLHVFLTDLLTAEPLPQALVVVKDKEGKILDRAYSDKWGRASLKKPQEGRYLEVWAGDQFAFMSLTSSFLNQSLFDVGGLQKQDGLNAFLYTERGVYRPGDEVNLSAIIRNEENTFPENHPLTLKVYTPQNRLYHEAVAWEARDGFYNFSFSIANTAPTGSWWAHLEVGGRVFYHELRVEEIVPYRLRVDISGSQTELGLGTEEIDLTVRAEYLFGAPGAGLASETTLTVEAYDISFPAYSNFVFGNDSLEYRSLEDRFYQELDEEGEAHLSWVLPQLELVPSALRLRVAARVYESGGRAVPQTKIIPITPYPSYVGILQLENPELAMGAEPHFEIVHLSKEGEPLAASELSYKIYRLRHYWWWEYGSPDAFRRHYKANEQLVVEAQGTLTTDESGRAGLTHKLEDYGEILLEVKDPQGGHSAAYFFRSYWWGDSAETASPAALSLKLDRESYQPGEVAHLSLTAPAGARALLTVEKEGTLCEQRWEEIEETETVFTLEIKEEYIPNAYVCVFVYQPYGQTENDLPLRLYGIVPLKVESEGTRLEMELELPEAIRPQEKFTLGVQTADGRPAQFTVAVVDEGLLNITGFRTPDPWSYFYSKQRLRTQNYDNFSDIIDPSYGYIHNLFTVGGGLEADYRELQTPDPEARRFEAVSIFQGPLATDEKGWAEIELEIPNYLGSVRVMVVAAAQGNYGQASQDLPVKAPVMVLPTLPRVLRPWDSIRVPVTVFALEENLGEVRVGLKVEGPLEVLGQEEYVLEFEEATPQEVFFHLAAGEEVGSAELTVFAQALQDDFYNESRLALPITPANPYIYLSSEKIAAPQELVDLVLPPAGVPGTELVQLTVSPLRGLNMNHRLKWLLRYPYGCLEQVTSAVFPQLYLGRVFSLEAEQLEEIDENINEAIRAFSQYQLGSGGFSYWPGGGAVQEWTTNYAGHFLLEAQKQGYYVPRNLWEGWLGFQSQAARENRGHPYTRAYRLYLLAAADQPALSAMNYMRESELDQLENPEKHLLAAAYQLLGYEEISAEILQKADLTVAAYHEFGGTFGSALRDEAILLDTLLVLGRGDQAVSLYNNIAEALSSNRWYSTQTTAYSLLALTKYTERVKRELPLLKGEWSLGGEEPQEFSFQDIVMTIPLEALGGETLTFRNTGTTPLFVTLEWEGVPRRGELQAQASNLNLQVDFYDEAGAKLDVSSLTQGTSFYGVFRVSYEGMENLTELALVQVLPSGWEIENLRLVEGRLPAWTEKYYLERENYLDLRDDRVMWFFDLDWWVPGFDFIVKLNAVTVGRFYLPPTLLEAMYNNDYKVVTTGATVEVEPR